MGDADGGNVDASVDALESEMPDDKFPRQGEDVDVYRPKRRLRMCFLLLGMGGISYSAAVIQSAQYIDTQYAFNPAGGVGLRSCLMTYNFAFLLMATAAFFGGPSFWPNKRARMLYSYVAFFVAMSLAMVIEGAVNYSTAPSSDRRYAFSVWVVGSFFAGAADAAAGSVLNGEAAACKCNYYATYGRTACSFIVLGLRCIGKAALSPAAGDTSRLRQAAAIPVSFAVVLQLACVLIIAFVLPKLIQQVEENNDPDVPPGLNFQQTITTAYTALEGGLKGHEAAASLAAAGTLAPMQPGMDSTYGLPILQATTSRSPSKRLDLQISLARSLISMPTMQRPTQDNPTDNYSPEELRTPSQLQNSQSILLRTMAKHNPSFMSRRRRAQRDSMVSRAPDQDTAEAGLSEPTLSNRFRHSMRLSQAFSVSGKHLGPAHTSSMRRARLLSIRSGRQDRFADDNAQHDTNRHSHKWSDALSMSTKHEHSHSAGHHDAFGAPSMRRDAADAAADVSNSKDVSVDGGLGAALQASRSQGRPPVSNSIRQARTFRSTFRMSSIREGSKEFVDDLGLSPFHSQQLESESSLGDIDEGDAQPTPWETFVVWRKIMKQSFAYQLLVCIGPLLTGQLLPIAYAKQFPSSLLGGFYGQLVNFAQLFGSMLGSQLLPIFVGKVEEHVQEIVPAHPRRTLYGLFAGSLLFIPCFVLGVHYSDAAALIVLVFFLFTYGGYVNSLVFKLANRHMVVEDARIAQMSMVLTASATFFLGACLAWIWLPVKL